MCMIFISDWLFHAGKAKGGRGVIGFGNAAYLPDHLRDVL